ncbi:EAL domain-containing protein [Consotaella salsifontis]|nr:EAL domain-containing protein [Consotaella salsifontis]
MLADLALRDVKKQRKARSQIYEASMLGRTHRAAHIEARLLDAIEADRIEPYYQPIFEIDTRRIVGLEVLARWRQSGGDFVPPDVFIPIAEERQLIDALSERLLKRACVDARQWPEDIFLSFNISPVHMETEGWERRLMDILGQTGFAPSRLQVEITETSLASDLPAAARALAFLQKEGVAVALDDFGTGYSNLAQLSNFSFARIKIDRSFVAPLLEDERQQKIVRLMVALARVLDVWATAEGIETEEQLVLLGKLGCRYGQGYLVSRAVPSDEVVALLAAAPLGAATIGGQNLPEQGDATSCPRPRLQ